MGNCNESCRSLMTKAAVTLHLEAPTEISLQLFRAVRDGDIEAVRRLLDPKKFSLEKAEAQTTLNVKESEDEEDEEEQEGQKEIVPVAPEASVEDSNQTTTVTATTKKKTTRKKKKEKDVVPPPAHADVRDKTGAQPIHVAAEKGHLEIMELLIQYGADPRAKNFSGWEPAHSAAQNHRFDALQKLIDHTGGMAANARDDNGVSILHILAAEGFVEFAKLLLMTKLESTSLHLLIKDIYGYLPLHYAVEQRHFEFTHFWLRHLERHSPYPFSSAVINSHTASGATCLHLAVANGDEKMAELLLQFGADAGAGAKKKIQPIHICAERGYLSMMKLLLKYSVCPQLAVPPIYHRSATSASLSGRADDDNNDNVDGNVCANNNNNNNNKNNNSQKNTPCAAEVSEQREPVRNGADQQDEQQAEDWTTLLATSPLLESRTFDGFRCLMFAAAHNQVEMVRFLIEDMNVDQAAKSADGFTALDYAIVERNGEIAKLLGGELPPIVVPPPPAAPPPPSDEVAVSAGGEADPEVGGGDEEGERQHHSNQPPQQQQQLLQSEINTSDDDASVVVKREETTTHVLCSTDEHFSEQRQQDVGAKTIS